MAIKPVYFEIINDQTATKCPSHYGFEHYATAIDALIAAADTIIDDTNEDPFLVNLSLGQAMGAQRKRLKIGLALRAMDALRREGLPMSVTLAKYLTPDFLQEPGDPDVTRKPRKGLSHKILTAFCGRPGRDATVKIPAIEFAEIYRAKPQYQGMLANARATLKAATTYRLDATIARKEKKRAAGKQRS